MTPDLKLKEPAKDSDHKEHCCQDNENQDQMMHDLDPFSPVALAATPGNSRIRPTA
jgi:hypothetical protein